MKSKTRLTSILTVLTLIFGFIFIGIPGVIESPVSNATASITGDTYPGSGDWSILNATVYTGETFTVYGDITIAVNASLTLSDTTLTVDTLTPTITCEFGSPHAFFKMESGSILQTTNTSSGIPLLILVANGGAPNGAYFHIEDSEAYNVQFRVYTDTLCSIYSSTLYESQIVCYTTSGQPSTSPIYMYDVTIQDVDTTTQPSGTTRSVITLGSGSTIDDCTFSNITLNGRSSASNSFIRALSQTNLTITDNEFGDSTYPVISILTNEPYPVSDCLIERNEFGLIGGTLATACYGIYIDGHGYDSYISSNTFDEIRNGGSTGIYHTGEGWTFMDNEFGLIKSNETNTSTSYAIQIRRQGDIDFPDLFSGTIIDQIIGPGIDVGGHAMGFKTQSAGNFTITQSIIRAVGWAADGMAILDPVGSPGFGNIYLHANSISNICNLSNAIYVHSGWATVSWNNISGVDGSCAGVMVHGPRTPSYIHNNSVTGMFYAPNVWPDWQISVGAYCIVCDQVESVLAVCELKDNHAEGATAIHPDYDVMGDVLGGGYADNITALIDAPEDCIIQTKNANVMLRHNCQLYQIDYLGSPVPMMHYPNGTSMAWIEEYGTAYHWINITVLPIYLYTNAPVDVMVTGSITWETAAESAITFTVAGLASSLGYKVYQDGSVIAVGTGPSFSFTATGGGEFEVVVWHSKQVSSLVILTVNMVGLGILLGVLGNFAVPIARDIQKGKAIKPEQVTRDMIKTVIFIIVGCVMWAVLHSVAIG